MQVIWDQEMLPAALVGQTITSIRLRRPAFAGEPGYPAISRTVKLSMGMTTMLAGQMTADLTLNRPETLTVVAGPTALSVPATVAHGPGDLLAATFVTVSFSQPFTVESTGNLFLEWENVDSSLTVSPDHWVEAVQAPDAGGIAVELGNGGCGSRPIPMVLRWMPGVGPASERPTSLFLRGALPSAPTVVVLSLDPEDMAPPDNFGFGADLTIASAPGCFQWTRILGLPLPQATNAAGAMTIDLPFPSGLDLSEKKVVIQVAMLDPAANPLGIALSNGVILLMDTREYALQCSTLMMAGVGDTSPFPPLLGVAPVVTFGL